jgi:tRNA (guanine9-N1)-methyltransferase
VYVIGGLVDRTVQKGASLRLAQRCGARAVRLPIAEHLEQLGRGKGKGKEVLNVNDVFQALLAVHAGQGWREALERAVPQRFRHQAAAVAAAAAPEVEVEAGGRAAAGAAEATRAVGAEQRPIAAAAPAAAPLQQAPT